MSASIVLLCEDSQTACFVRRFLWPRNFRHRDIQVLPLLEGSGEQWVRKRYPHELKAIRGRQKAVLVVVIDADVNTTAFRRTQLNDECIRKEVPPTAPDDPVMIIVPKRNIETWFAYLRGDADVDETRRYRKLKKESDCHPLADELYRMCHERHRLDPSAPPSLREACQEYPKLSRALR